MINITFLVSDLNKIGGVQRVVSIISNSLADKTYNISILSLFKGNSTLAYNLNPSIKTDYLFDHYFDLRKNFIRVSTELRRNLSDKKMDIMVIAGMGLVPFAKVATFNKKIKLIGWEHQHFDNGKKLGLDWTGKRIANYGMDAVVVLTKADFKAYTEKLYKANKVTQIYNPTEIKASNTPYNFNDKKIISVGSLVHRKGFDMALEVAKNIFAKYPEWKWEIYGEGPERNNLEKKIKEYNLEKNFILMGHTDEMYNIYDNYALYVMTSRSEGFPMVLIEAKANKLPVISFDCKNGPDEMITEGINGNIIRNFNIEEMSSRIISFIEDKNKAQKFSENSGIELKNLDIEVITNQWLDLFEDIL